jgi:hypothetical protein
MAQYSQYFGRPPGGCRGTENQLGRCNHNPDFRNIATIRIYCGRAGFKKLLICNNGLSKFDVSTSATPSRIRICWDLSLDLAGSCGSVEVQFEGSPSQFCAFLLLCTATIDCESVDKQLWSYISLKKLQLIICK